VAVNDRELLLLILEHVVRLESRLEKAGVLGGNVSYTNDVLRFALENNIEPERPAMMDDPVVTQAFVTGVMDQLDAIEAGSFKGYYALEDRLGGRQRRGQIIAALKYIKLSGRYEDTIAGLAEGAPVEAHGLTRSPYHREDA
jgi:hypothetical protein